MTQRQQRKTRTSQLDAWKEAANSLFAEFPGEGGVRIAQRLEQTARGDVELRQLLEVLDLPDPRTLDRWKQAFTALSGEEQSLYRVYHWPESHEQGAVPWDAAGVAVAIAQSRRDQGREPPSVRQIRWAHRLKLSAPDMPTVGEVEVTGSELELLKMGGFKLFWNIELVSEILALAFGKTQIWRPAIAEDMRVSLQEIVEDYLASAPWRSLDRAYAYLFNNQIRWRGPAGLVRWGEPTDDILDQGSKMGFYAIPYEGRGPRQAESPDEMESDHE